MVGCEDRWIIGLLWGGGEMGLVTNGKCLFLGCGFGIFDRLREGEGEGFDRRV